MPDSASQLIVYHVHGATVAAVRGKDRSLRGAPLCFLEPGGNPATLSEWIERHGGAEASALIWQPKAKSLAWIDPAPLEDASGEPLRAALKAHFGERAAHAEFLGWSPDGAREWDFSAPITVAALDPEDRREALQFAADLGLQAPTLHLPCQGSLAALSARAPDFEGFGPVCFLEFQATHLQLIFASERGIEQVERFPVGLEGLGEVLKEVLSLRFAGTALRLLLNDKFDFSTTAEPIVATLLERLGSPFAEVLAARHNAHGPFTVIVQGLPATSQWLADRLGGALGGTPPAPSLLEAFQLGPFCGTSALALLPLTGALRRDPADPWFVSFDDHAFGLTDSQQIALSAATLSAAEIAEFQADANATATDPEDVSVFAEIDADLAEDAAQFDEASVFAEIDADLEEEAAQFDEASVFAEIEADAAEEASEPTAELTSATSAMDSLPVDAADPDRRDEVEPSQPAADGRAPDTEPVDAAYADSGQFEADDFADFDFNDDVIDAAFATTEPSTETETEPEPEVEAKTETPTRPATARPEAPRPEAPAVAFAQPEAPAPIAEPDFEAEPDAPVGAETEPSFASSEATMEPLPPGFPAEFAPEAAAVAPAAAPEIPSDLEPACTESAAATEPDPEIDAAFIEPPIEAWPPPVPPPPPVPVATAPRPVKAMPPPAADPAPPTAAKRAVGLVWLVRGLAALITLAVIGLFALRAFALVAPAAGNPEAAPVGFPPPPSIDPATAPEPFAIGQPAFSDASRPASEGERALPGTTLAADATSRDPLSAGAPRLAPSVSPTPYLLRSEPAGAEVWSEGTRLGVTPLALDPATLPSREVELRLDGFRPQSIQLASSAGTAGPPAPFALVPRYGAVSLAAGSRPTQFALRAAHAAEPIASGSLPQTVPLLPPGTYEVQFTTAPDLRWSQPVVIEDGLTAHLTTDPPAGSLTLASEPTGATILDADGSIVGRTPFAWESLPAGLHRYRLTLDGCEDLPLTVHIDPGQSQEVNAQLIDLNGIFSASDVDVLPEIASAPVTANHRLLRSLEAPLAVPVRLVIGRNGRTESAEVIGEFADPIAREARRIADRLRFAPARRADLPVRVEVRIPILFRPPQWSDEEIDAYFAEHSSARAHPPPPRPTETAQAEY